MRGDRVRGPVLRVALATLLAAATALHAQIDATRTLELEGGERISYTLRTHPANAHLLDPASEIAPTSALNTAKLLIRHLSAGGIEEAAMLSNSPRRRFEVFRDRRNAIGEDQFKRVFAQYFDPENQLLAEVAIGRHHLLIWRLKELDHLAGLYFVEVGGRYLIDDVPSDERSRLRRVLEAWRRGAINP